MRGFYRLVLIMSLVLVGGGAVQAGPFSALKNNIPIRALEGNPQFKFLPAGGTPDSACPPGKDQGGILANWIFETNGADGKTNAVDQYTRELDKDHLIANFSLAKLEDLKDIKLTITTIGINQCPVGHLILQETDLSGKAFPYEIIPLTAERINSPGSSFNCTYQHTISQAKVKGMLDKTEAIPGVPQAINLKTQFCATGDNYAEQASLKNDMQISVGSISNFQTGLPDDNLGFSLVTGVGDAPWKPFQSVGVPASAQ